MASFLLAKSFFAEPKPFRQTAVLSTLRSHFCREIPMRNHLEITICESTRRQSDINKGNPLAIDSAAPAASDHSDYP
jgi:hypothetical protein